MQLLLRHVEGTDYHLPVHLALRVGLRRSELCGLFWSDLSLEESSLSVLRTMVSLPGEPAHLDEPKSKRFRRVVAFGTETAELLKDWRAVLGEHGTLGRSQVCARRGGSNILPDVLSRMFSLIMRDCNIQGVSFHDLRHTHATLLLTSGVPVHVVSARLGHASIQTTVVHLWPRDTRLGRGSGQGNRTEAGAVTFAKCLQNARPDAKIKEIRS